MYRARVINRRKALGLLVAAVLAGSVTGRAEAKRGRRGRGRRRHDDEEYEHDDHYEAWRARGRRTIYPLSEIMREVRKLFSGDLIDVELRRVKGSWIYELKLLSRKGRYTQITVDARTKVILKVRER